MKALIRSVLLILLLCSLLPLNTVLAIPPTGNEFYGYVMLDDSAAPDDTSVTATMNGRTFSTTTFSTTTSIGIYELTISPIEGDEVGDSITFYVAGYIAGSASLNQGSPRQLDLSANSPLPNYTLSINVNPSDSGSVTGAGTFESGTTRTIRAAAAYGWIFVNWTGDTGTIADTFDATTTITMNDNYSITANFVQAETHNLTILISGQGTTEPPDGIYTYVVGEEVNITATPAIGWKFDSWTGDVATPSSPST
ncbi:MAG: hypothetical protein PHE15_03035, partial [Dehalococcoidales bacterium]|nr:hypothetical protein [Dehalococcoidales bacterium]